MFNKSKRNSNIELLRLLLIFFVIYIHYTGRWIGNACYFAQEADKTSNYLLLTFLRSFCVCAVDCFVLISGFFLIKNNEVHLSKIFTIELPVIFYSLFLYIIKLFLKTEHFSIRGIIEAALPRNWYAHLYCCLYIIHPLINKAIKDLSRKLFCITILIVFILFSVIPTFLRTSCELFNISYSGFSTISTGAVEDGQNLINFILMYILGAYININLNKFTSPRISIISPILYIISIGAIFIYQLYFGTIISGYSNFFVIISAISLFLIFIRINIKSSCINMFSSQVWGIYLIHSTLITNILSGFLKIQEFAISSFITVLTYSLFSCLIILFISFILSLLFSILLKPILYLLNKLNIDFNLIYNGAN